MTRNGEHIPESAGQPLRGRRIVITRAGDQSQGLSAHLSALGAAPIKCPAIQIVPPESYTHLDTAISNLESYDWVIFTSVNGISALLSRMVELGKSRDVLCSRKLAAVGRATRDALAGAGCETAFMPDSYVAEAIIEHVGDVAGCRVLLPKADIAREVLAEGLRLKGASVDEVDAYRTIPGRGPAALKDLLMEEGVDAVTFTSSSTVRYTLRGMVEAGLEEAQAVSLLNGTVIICIGPITEQTARKSGLQVTAVADEYTTHGLVNALVEVFTHQRGEAKDA